MSASDTGDDLPLIHCLSSVLNMRSASAPASRTASVNNALSRTRAGSAASNGETFDPHGRGIQAVAERQIVGRGQRLEDLEQVPRDRDFADRVGDLAVLDPEPAGAA